MINPDLGDAKRFIHALTGDADTPCTWQTFDDNRDRHDQGMVGVLNGPIAEHWDKLAALNVRGAGVFITINETDLKGRKKPNIKAVRAVFVDSDNGPLPTKMPAQPSAIVRSAHGDHAYWFVKPGAELDKFEDTQKRFLTKLGTDPAVFGVERVMRLPGFYNHKGDPFLVRLVHCQPEIRYTMDDLRSRVPALPKSLPKNAPPPPILDDRAVARALKWVAKVPGAVEGDMGDAATFRVAASLVNGFALSDGDALAVMEQWNERCSPPWDTKELRLKIRNAKRYGKQPVGSKLGPEPYRQPPPVQAVTAPQPAVDVPEIIAGESPAVLNMADVEMKPLKWLWPGYLPLGKLSLLDGDPCLGKSMVTLDMAARVSTGRTMPDNSAGDVFGSAGVVLMSCEDDAADTVKPRLVAAGADCSKIRLVTGVKETRQTDSGEWRTTMRMPTLEDVSILRTVIDEVGAKLVIIDPLMAYMKGDTHRDSDARQGLAPLQKLAEDTASTILVVRHLTKSGGSNALYRGGGSIGIIGAARAGLIIAKDPDDKTGRRRIMARTKANLAPDEESSLVYEIMSGEPAPRVEWMGTSQHTATSVLSVPVDEEEKSQLEEACDWLRDALKNGQQMQKDLLKKAKTDGGISEITLRRAKSRMRIVSIKGFGGWIWNLPEKINTLKGSNTLTHEHVDKNTLSFHKNNNNNNNLAQGAQGAQHAHVSVLGGTDEHVEKWDANQAQKLIQETITAIGNASNGSAEKFTQRCREAFKLMSMEQIADACDWYRERAAMIGEQNVH